MNSLNYLSNVTILFLKENLSPIPSWTQWQFRKEVLRKAEISNIRSYFIHIFIGQKEKKEISSAAVKLTKYTSKIISGFFRGKGQKAHTLK